MPRAMFSSPVDAPAEVVWRLLLDKIEHPDRYIDGVSDVEILERGADGSVLRRMRTPRMLLTERIMADESELLVSFVLVGSPVFDGGVTNRIDIGADGRPVLTVDLDWVPVDMRFPDDTDMTGLVRSTVLKIKALAESGGID